MGGRLDGVGVRHDTRVMTRRVEAEVSFRFRGALSRSGRAAKTIDKRATVSTDRGEPRRTIRVGDDLWSRALAAPAPTADRRVIVTVPAGSSLPKAIQAFLVAYVGQAPPSGGATADESA